MGGRGASSGTYKLNLNGKELSLEYGDEFNSLAEFSTSRGRVKVLKNKIAKNKKLPMETMTPGRIYAMTDHTGHVSDIVFFDKAGKRSEVWNIATYEGSHRHYGSGNHKHVGYEHSELGGRKLSKSEVRFAREVQRKWARAMARSGTDAR